MEYARIAGVSSQMPDTTKYAWEWMKATLHRESHQLSPSNGHPPHWPNDKSGIRLILQVPDHQSIYFQTPQHREPHH